MTIFRFSIVSAIGLLASAVPATANQLVRMSHAAKLQAADLVAVVRVIDCPPSRMRDRPCKLNIVETIKGKSIPSITLGRDRGIVEQYVDCCEASRSYLVYLEYGNGKWWSVNGRYGVIDLGRTEKEK